MAFQALTLLLLQFSERPQVPGNPVREMSTFSSECHFAAIRDIHTWFSLSVWLLIHMGRGKKGPGLVRAKSLPLGCGYWGAVTGLGTNSLHQGMKLKSENHSPQTEPAAPRAAHHPSVHPKTSWGFPHIISEPDMGVPQAESQLRESKETAAVSENEIWKVPVMSAGHWRLSQRCDHIQHKTQIPLHKIIHIFLGSEWSQQKEIAVKASRDLKIKTEKCRGVCCSSSWICEASKDWNGGCATSLTKPDTLDSYIRVNDLLAPNRIQDVQFP